MQDGNAMSKETIGKRQAFLILAAALALSLIVPHLIRASSHGGILMGDISHYHARIAEEMAAGGIPREDTLAYGGREYIFSPYHALLAAASPAFGAEWASRIIPAVSGIFSLALFYLILKKLNFHLLGRLSASAVLALSPVFAHSFALSSPVSIMILLDLFGIYLYLHRGKSFAAASGLALSAASFFSFSNMIFALLAVFAYSSIKEEDRKRASIVTFFIVLVLLFHYIPFYFSHGFPEGGSISQAGRIQEFVSDLGGRSGFSIFGLILAGIGLASNWRRKKALYPAYLLSIFAVAWSFFFSYALAYSNFAVSIFAGMAFAGLAKMKWELRQIRNLSLLLLFCGVLFSSVSYSARIGNSPPDQGTVSALEWLRENSAEGDVVFSHYSNGFWIERYSGRAALTDGLFEYSPRLAEYLNDSETIFNTLDIRETRSLLSRHNVKFILMTGGMDQGIVWDKPGQGLSFLLKNSETFKKEYINPSAEIYEYIYSGEE